MCIRDSVGDGQPGHDHVEAALTRIRSGARRVCVDADRHVGAGPVRRRRPLVDAAAPSGVIVATEYDACLLYTSDAADDLLCVDLGGRRIIKKKNINIHNNGPE
mgnify:CR=1 FL=1